jgi:hypothetical protein
MAKTANTIEDRFLIAVQHSLDGAVPDPQKVIDCVTEALEESAVADGEEFSARITVLKVWPRKTVHVERPGANGAEPAGDG